MVSLDQVTARSLFRHYIEGPLCDQPAYPYLRTSVPKALILVTGSYSIGTARPGSDMDIESIVPDEAYPAMLQEAGGPRGSGSMRRPTPRWWT